MKLETQTEQLISETVTVYGLSPQIGVHALAQTANALAAQGTVFSVCPDITEDEETDTDIKNEDMQDTHETSASVSVQIAYPEYVFKSRIHKIEKLLKKACKKYNINLVAVQASANPAVQVIAVTVTGIAKAPKEEAWNRETARACKDIVFVGHAGMDGMLRITEADKVIRTADICSKRNRSRKSRGRICRTSGRRWRNLGSTVESCTGT